MRTLRLALTAGLLIAGVMGLFAAGELSGTWEMTVTGTPHGDMTASLALTHEGEDVKGRLKTHGAEHKMAGTFRGDTLELATVDAPADHKLELTAKLQADGTLSGFLSSPAGDMKWTASKARESK